MSTNATAPDSDKPVPAAPDTAPAQGDAPEPTAPGGALRPAASPDAYKQRHHGRQYMDAWMLHQTMLIDFADEHTTGGAPAAPGRLAAPGAAAREPGIS